MTIETIGITHNDMGQYNYALSYHNKSLKIHEGLNDRVQIVLDYMNIGYLHIAKKDEGKAKEAADNASFKDEFERDTETEHPLKNLITELLTSINESTD